ncbi:hypothetical protein BU299_25295 [Salmonella enterica]|nr:hypothetical protein [Salmonella enterica]EBM1867606.1 hypothetical protein [Salmonella enterica]EBN5806532.1 hypothetical protein [Salmonella enterica]
MSVFYVTKIGFMIFCYDKKGCISFVKLLRKLFTVALSDDMGVDITLTISLLEVVTIMGMVNQHGIN